MSKILIDRKLVEFALEALDACGSLAAPALRAALAEPVQDHFPDATKMVQEPVAWRFKPMIGWPWSLSDDGYYISCKRDQGYFVEPLYTAPPQRPAEPVQEPVTAAWDGRCMLGHCNSPAGCENSGECRAIERAHGIKEEK